MTKNFKLVLALVLSIMMILSSVSALAAAGDPTYTITITPNADDKGTHTYGAYQIFKGNLNATEKTIGDIEWGSGITDAGKTALGDAAEYAKGMNEANAAEKAAQLAMYLASPEQTGSTSITGLEGGYYLVQDESTSPTGTDPKAKTRYILEVVTDVTVTVKSSVPSVEKKVKEKNDSTGVESDWLDAADYDFEDVIPYKITATIGSGIDNFTAYSLQFQDDMSKGLVLQKGWTIKLNGTTDITSAFTKGNGTSSYTDGTMHTWSITDLKGIEDATSTSTPKAKLAIKAGDTVVLEYTAKLDKDKAVIGSDGNPNKVVLKYDNNPNNCGEGKPEGTTPEDKVTVFTYKIVANKIDGENKALEGAGFTLFKLVKPASGDATWAKIGDEITGVTTFNFNGKDTGAYKLEETTVPAGYNKADDIYFYVEGTYDTSKDDPKLTSLDVYECSSDGVKGSKKLNGVDDATFSTSITGTDDGSVKTDVINEKGATLPSTGGIGTTIFYVAGSIMVLAAAILLITKRRMGAND